MKEEQIYNQLRRFVIIYDLLNKNEYTLRDEFKDVLKNRLKHFANRTFERDIYKLKEQFGLVIHYKNRYGYYLDDAYFQDTSRIESLMHLVDSTVFKLKNLKT